MQWAANLSMLFTETDWAARFSRARAAGFSAVEIQFPYEMALGDCEKYLKNNGLKLALMNLPAADLLQGGLGLACVPARRAAFREALDLALSYADVLKPSCVNVLAGRVGEEGAAVAREVLLENLALAADKFADLGITITCEAINPFDMPHYLINTGADMLALRRDLQRDHFGAQVDVYHFARQNLDPLAWISEHLDFVAHIQFADCPNRGEPGTGELDFAVLFAELARLKYSRYVAAEYRPSRRTEDTLAWFKAQSS